MKLLAYDIESGNVRLDEKVSIENFAKYISSLWSDVKEDPSIEYTNIGALFRQRVPVGEEDYAIGKEFTSPDLIVMGDKSPIDTHTLTFYFADPDDVNKFKSKLESICNSD